MMKDKKIVILAALSVAVITFPVYLPSLRNEFVNWDDNRYIYDNVFIRGLDTGFFKWAFLDFYMANWHPLTWISHALDFALWGLDPLGHHLTSVILHSVNTFLVVLLVVRLLEAVHDSRFTTHDSRFRFTLIAAATTGLLFGLHPLHVESVAWVSERKDLLCALFFLLSIMSYTSYTTDKTSRTYFLTLGFFILALLSKPMAVTLPAVLIILDWCPLGRIASLRALKTVLVEKVPFFMLSILSSVLTILAQRQGDAVTSLKKLYLSKRLAVSADAMLSYVVKMLFPANLTPYYPYPQDVSPASLKYLIPVLLVIGIAIVCIVVSRRQRLWLAAFGYYVITLLPVIGIVQVGDQSMADRYTYLPSLGPFLLAGLIAAWGYERIRIRGALLKAAGAVVFAALISLSYLTVQQIGVWRDSLTLWNYVIEKKPGRISLAYNNRGLIYDKMGRFDLAVNDYSMALRIDPLNKSAYNNRGVIFSKSGLFSKAIEDYTMALRLSPKFAEAYNNRGIAFKEMGLIDKAIEEYGRAIAADPTYVRAYINRAIAYSKKGLIDLAMNDYNTAMRIDPDITATAITR